MSLAEFDADVVIDARDCILGRVASEVAQRAMAGEKIAIINAEDAVITGSDDDIMSVYRKRLDVGSDRGPYYPKRPDRIFKRAVRGMLPYKKPRERSRLRRQPVRRGRRSARRDVPGPTVEYQVHLPRGDQRKTGC